MAIIVRDLVTASCEECGMGAVPHGIQRVSVALDSFMAWLLRPVDALFRVFLPPANALLDRLSPWIANLLFRTGFAVRVDAPDAHSSETAQALWEEAARRGIEMYEVRPLGLPRRQFIARWHTPEGATKTIAFEGLPRPARAQRSLHWIDDKAEVKRRFRAAGFPIAEGGHASNEHGALALFRALRKPVIVKPRHGSGGRHTTVDIAAEDELVAAFRSARMVAPAAMIEEQLYGPVFRATLVDGALTAVMRRDPPQVIGDGRRSVRELVEEENRNPLRRGPVFANINIDSPVTERELARQKLTLESVPEAGRRVFFHFKVNWGVGGTSRDATTETHPENAKLFGDIGAYLGEDIVGIDFIIEDIGQSWREQGRCGVIECNSLPLIGNHHFPYIGPVRNVAAAVWDMVFPASAPR